MKKEIKFSSVGLFSGEIVNASLCVGDKPGIFFQRTDLSNAAPMPAIWNNVSNTGLTNTTVGRAPNHVQTIEHFMAALFVCGIDSAIIKLDSFELPIMDGSAREFIDLFEKNGLCKPWTGKKIIVKKEIIAYRQELIKQMPKLKRFALWLHGLKTKRKEDGFVKLSPDSRGFVLDVTLDYPDKVIGKQSFEFIFDGSESARNFFKENIAQCRTFGRLWEWKYLKKRGMGRGATTENVIVLMNGKNDWDKLKSLGFNSVELNKLLKNKGCDTLKPLYFSDEFVRHKLIDTLGDFYTSGGMVVGKLESYKGSHALNNLVLKKLFSDPSNYDIID